MTKLKYAQLVSLNVQYDTNNEELTLEDKENIKQQMIKKLNETNFWENIEHYDTENNDE